MPSRQREDCVMVGPFLDPLLVLVVEDRCDDQRPCRRCNRNGTFLGGGRATTVSTHYTHYSRAAINLSSGAERSDIYLGHVDLDLQDELSSSPVLLLWPWVGYVRTKNPNSGTVRYRIPAGRTKASQQISCFLSISMPLSWQCSNLIVTNLRSKKPIPHQFCCRLEFH